MANLHIATELNRVKSVGQARAAVGGILKVASATYPIVPKIGNAALRDSSRKALDTARATVEGWYPKLGTSLTSPVDAGIWASTRKAIERLNVEIAGIEGAASYKPQTSNLTILSDAISEAPGVFAKQAAKVVNIATKAAGDVASGALSGVFGGLGVWGLVLIAGAALFLALRLGVI